MKHLTHQTFRFVFFSYPADDDGLFVCRSRELSASKLLIFHVFLSVLLTTIDFVFISSVAWSTWSSFVDCWTHLVGDDDRAPHTIFCILVYYFLRALHKATLNRIEIREKLLLRVSTSRSKFPDLVNHHLPKRSAVNQILHKRFARCCYRWHQICFASYIKLFKRLAVSSYKGLKP